MTRIWLVFLLLSVLVAIGETRIVYGRKLKRERSPSFAVTIHDESQTEFNCGATLIGPSVVHTAAHCLTNITRRNRVVLTINDFYADISEADTEYIRKSSDVYMAATSFKDKRDDFGLIFLEHSVPVCDHSDDSVSVPIILDNYIFPNASQLKPDPKTCYVMGWGMNEYGKFDKNIKVAKVQEMNIASGKIMVSRYNDHATACNRFQFNELDVILFQGDSGSPMICNYKSMPVLMGNVAGGIDKPSLRPWMSRDEKCRNRIDVYSYIYYQMADIERQIRQRGKWEEFVRAQRRCKSKYQH